MVTRYEEYENGHALGRRIAQDMSRRAEIPLGLTGDDAARWLRGFAAGVVTQTIIALGIAPDMLGRMDLRSAAELLAAMEGNDQT